MKTKRETKLKMLPWEGNVVLCTKHGAYDSGLVYKYGDVVTIGKNHWLACQAVPLGTKPPNTAGGASDYWKAIGW